MKQYEFWLKSLSVLELPWNINEAQHVVSTIIHFDGPQYWIITWSTVQNMSNAFDWFMWEVKRRYIMQFHVEQKLMATLRIGKKYLKNVLNI